MQLLYIALLLKFSLSASVDKELLELQKEKSMLVDKLDQVLKKEIDSLKSIQNEDNLDKHSKKVHQLRSYVEELKNGDALEEAQQKVTGPGSLSRMFRRQLLLGSSGPPSVSVPVGSPGALLDVDVVEGHRDVIKFEGKNKEVVIQKEDFDRPVANALDKHRWFFSDLSDEAIVETNTTKAYNWEQCPKWGKSGSKGVYPCCRKCCKMSMLGCLRRK